VRLRFRYGAEIRIRILAMLCKPTALQGGAALLWKDRPAPILARGGSLYARGRTTTSVAMTEATIMAMPA
jgi:hypothetical protein